jgi:hypothetical protein
MGPEDIRWLKMQRWISHCIEEIGWAAVYVFPTPDKPDLIPFTYTIGLTSKNLPELILFGLGDRQAHGIISSAIANLDLTTVEEYVSYNEVSKNLPVEFRDLPQSSVEEYLCQASAYYSDKKLVRARQLIWPDAKGRFPWHRDCEPKYARLQSEVIDWRLN